MPKLWRDTIEQHRQEVREAVIDATARLVETEGALSVTMARVAEEAGIGRATLYKYFPDLPSILLAWHDQQIAQHLDRLAAAGDRPGDAADRLRSVLTTYAAIVGEAEGHGATDLAGLLHHGEHVDRAERELHEMVRDLIAASAADGAVRADVPPADLAAFALSALQPSRMSSSSERRLALVFELLEPRTAPSA